MAAHNIVVRERTGKQDLEKKTSIEIDDYFSKALFNGFIVFAFYAIYFIKVGYTYAQYFSRKAIVSIT